MKSFVEECCISWLGNPDPHPEGTEATCPNPQCERSWHTRACAGDEHVSAEWICLEPGLGVSVETDEEGNEVEHTKILAWGGSMPLGKAFEGKEDDIAYPAGHTVGREAINSTSDASQPGRVRPPS